MTHSEHSNDLDKIIEVMSNAFEDLVDCANHLEDVRKNKLAEELRTISGQIENLMYRIK